MVNNPSKKLVKAAGLSVQDILSNLQMESPKKPRKAFYSPHPTAAGFRSTELLMQHNNELEEEEQAAKNAKPPLMRPRFDHRNLTKQEVETACDDRGMVAVSQDEYNERKHVYKFDLEGKSYDDYVETNEITSMDEESMSESMGNASMPISLSCEHCDESFEDLLQRTSHIMRKHTRICFVCNSDIVDVQAEKNFTLRASRIRRKKWSRVKEAEFRKWWGKKKKIHLKTIHKKQYVEHKVLRRQAYNKEH